MDQDLPGVDQDLPGVDQDLPGGTGHSRGRGAGVETKRETGGAGVARARRGHVLCPLVVKIRRVPQFIVESGLYLPPLLEWGCEAYPRAAFFLRGGGAAGRICPLSVCLFAEAGLKKLDFSKKDPWFWPFGGATLPPRISEVMLERFCWQIFPKQHFSGPADQ